MFLRGLNIVGKQLFYFAVVSCVLGLLALTAAVWLSDQIAKRKDEIAVWVSEQIGYPVEIGNAGIYLLDLIPKLELDKLKIAHADSDKTLFSADQVYLKLDLLSTLQQQEPVIADISVVKAALSLSRDRDGNFKVVGLKPSENTSSDMDFKTILNKAGWLQNLELKQIAIHYQDKKQPQLNGVYTMQQWQLSAEDEGWLTAAILDVPNQVGERIQLEGQFNFDEQAHLTDSKWLLQSNYIQLASFLSGIDFGGIDLQQGGGAIQAELIQYEQDNFDVKLKLGLRDLHLASTVTDRQVEPVVMKQMAGTLSWHGNLDVWSVSAENIQLQFAEQAWPLSHFKVSRNEQGIIQFASDYLNLADLTSLTQLVRQAPEFLIQTKPAGDINRLALSYSPEAGLTDISLRATELSMLPWNEYPGVNKLSFALDWKQGVGKLNFNSHQTTIYPQSWLEDPVYLESLTGNLLFSKQDKGWKATAETLRLWNDDFSIQADGRLQQQQDVWDSDISLSLQDVVINRWKAYVPEKILPEDFKIWSADAFVDGRIVNGRISMKGDPLAFPFDTEPNKGQFDMQLSVDNAQLHFAPDWPDLKQTKAQISGHGNDLLITSQSGNIAGFNFIDATTRISNLVRPKPILTVEGILAGGSHQALAFLQNSPLKRRFGDIAEWVSLKGKSQIALNLTVPLTHVVDTDVAGTLSFVDSTLSTKAVPGLLVKKVNGQLAFNNKGVSAQKITAETLGAPININVSNKNRETWIDIHGTTNMASLRQLWPDAIPAFVKGKTSYLTRLVIDEKKAGQFGVKVNINSDLKGVNIDAPAPLAKAAADSAQFSLDLSPKNTTQLIYDLRYQDWLQALFSFDDKQKIVGEIGLYQAVQQVDWSTFTLSGKLAHFDLEQWLDWQAGQPETEGSFSQQLSGIDVSIDKFILFGQEFNALDIKAKRQTDSWRAMLTAPQVKGNLTIPDNLDAFSPITAQLDYLHVVLPKDTAESTSKVSSKTELWPALKLNIADLQVDKLLLGELQLDASRTADSWALHSASLSSDVYSAQAKGLWLKQAEQERSQFVVQVRSEKLKGLLGRFGYQQVIDATDAEMSSDLSWPGSPIDFSRETAQGELKLKVGRGQLLDIDPGAAGRVFGLLSVAALPRRLALDFSDLFGKGFDFSSIKGGFTLKAGIAHTDDLVMQGDAATIALKGPINIVDKTYDQVVKVTPKVSSTLPIAGAVAGGPIGLGVGTAILLVDKIAGSIFDRELVNIISYNYKLTGAWEDPQLTIVNPVSK